MIKIQKNRNDNKQKLFERLLHSWDDNWSKDTFELTHEQANKFYSLHYNKKMHCIECLCDWVTRMEIIYFLELENSVDTNWDNQNLIVEDRFKDLLAEVKMRFL